LSVSVLLPIEIIELMLGLPNEIIPPLCVIALGFFSFIIRSIANFQLEGTGSDLALISSSLQLSLVLGRLKEASTELVPIMQTDVLIFLVLLMLWATSVKVVQRALQTDRRILKGLINPYSFLAFIVGSMALTSEILWRLQYV
jgi:hypothetical protein